MKAQKREMVRRTQEDIEEIEFRDVSFCYPGTDKDILSHCSFRIHRGERIALVGVNGAGKTTVIKLLCGFFSPDSGEIRINGRPAADLSGSIAAIFQDVRLFAFTVRENIVLGNGSEEEKLRRLLQTELLAFVDALPQKEHTYLYKSFHDEGIEISGGQAQRLAIARGIYKDAPLLLLDEPAAALDPKAENYLYHQFAEITRDKTAVYISHHLSSTRFCDRIIVLDGGRVRETGTHEELILHNGIYAEMFEKQASFFEEAAKGEPECLRAEQMESTRRKGK
ncbi:MAG: ABC transporter ATP-binding protein [Lachnospiraceae bacterium]|nr:ABC transporter ATP-binding protein [Lachnospiraceae bacterium]